ncbi:phage tail sheath family protein [Actinacidiphila bryophytorum]|jgi:phage tail sheath protein FI|uniref:phage tail sheath family protein n=1 Tax=Actinacidiphila bryophytorum TaxID=1436133 RepID=UPI002176A04B|nr:phage tail sheath subtilisin-like domain-containing protein [Actinacidiphila bryophytorum]UWE07652.1 phage tail sheath subtilisin-like domain-containing protein [Actinacidiphila bryophytorum]
MPSYKSPGVYVEEVEAGSRPIEGVGTAVAAFVGLAARGPYNRPVLVTNWSQYTRTFGDFVDGAYLAHSVYGYFLNGGGTCYVVRIGEPAHEGGDAAPARSGKSRGKQAPSLPAGPRVALGGFQVAAAEGSGEGLSVEVADAGGEGAAEEAFTLLVKRDGEVEESFDVSAKRSQRTYVVSVVRDKSRLVVVDEPSGTAAVARPDNQTVALPPAESGPAALPATITPAEYVGDASDRTGFAGLEAVDEVTMLAVPDLMSAYEQGALDAEGVKAVQLAMIAHCELMGNRVAIIDPPPALSPQEVKDWRMTGAGYDSKYAALYYPWVKVADPSTGRARFVPPSGAMAGVWARNDDTRGVHKAPANEVVRGAVELAVQLTKGENDLLNPIGVNCIRAFPGRGIRVWGARTLSSDDAWRYLNVRRLFNYLEESILLGTQWVVFEPNDDALWARIRRTISAFLVNEWRKGALFGLTPDEAFYVKCDRETNPAQGIDAGEVVCEVGIAPVKPAEFVIFRLAQFSGGTSLVNE